MNKIKTILVSLAAFGLMAVPAVASATTIQNSLACGTDLSGTTTAICNVGTTDATSSLSNLIDDVITIFSWLVGGISIIMIIYGGFRYVTSGGNDSSVSGAKNTIIYALIGLVIVALAQVIVHFVLSKAFGVSSGGTTPTGGIIYSAAHLL